MTAEDIKSITDANLLAEIAKQGDVIKALKGQKVPKDELQPHVDRLVALKAEAAIRAEARNEKKFDRAGLESLLLKRFFYAPSFAIYGGVTGLYDYGPPGTALQNNIISLWRKHFVLEEDMHEIECTNLTPEAVLKTSGHVDRFADYMVRDVKTGDIFRADHLVKQVLKDRLENDQELRAGTFDKKKVPKGKPMPTQLEPAVREEYELILESLDNYQGDALWKLMQKLEVKAPETGNDITEPKLFNLMFETQIGPTGQFRGYLRPETAQGHFLNFKRLLEFNVDQMPFASASIGKSFRNEISPRQGLLRVREFTMAEIEHFVDPTDKAHPRFDSVRNVEIPLYSASAQLAGSGPSVKTIGEAVDSGLVNNQTLGYFIARIYQFLIRIGINKNRLRFRQHMANEMAHYACDCWDAEIESSYGWIECVGCADRSAYDLTAHSKATKEKLVVRQALPEPIVRERLVMEVNKSVFGPSFKANAKFVQGYINSLLVEGGSEDEWDEVKLAELQKKMADGGDKATIVGTDGKEYELTGKMIKIFRKTEKINIREYIPSVIEPSFGLGRVMYSLLEHSWYIREGDEQRHVLSFPPVIAPIKALILPISSSPSFVPFLKRIADGLRKEGISNRIDDTGASIGKRYARNDELGTPFAVTVDFQTVKDSTVTLRERDSLKQIRESIPTIVNVIRDLVEERITWDDVLAKYPAFVSQSVDPDNERVINGDGTETRLGELPGSKLEYLIDNPIYPVQSIPSIPEFNRTIHPLDEDNDDRQDCNCTNETYTNITKTLLENNDQHYTLHNIGDNIITDVPDPYPHYGYMLQHGPTLLRNTLKRPEREHWIAFDVSLRYLFSELDMFLEGSSGKRSYCPIMPECKFYFSDDFESMATEADALVTDKNDNGLLVHNSSLHFTKIGILQDPAKPLENYSWWGTDAVGMHRVMLTNRQKSAPLQIPLYQISTPMRDLIQPVDISKKLPVAIFILPESICEAHRNRRDELVDTLRRVLASSPLPFKVLIPDRRNPFTTQESGGSGEADGFNLGLGTYGSCDLLWDLIDGVRLQTFGKVGTESIKSSSMYDSDQLDGALAQLDLVCPRPTGWNMNQLDTLDFLRMKDRYFQCLLEHALVSIVFEPYFSPNLISDWVWKSFAAGTVVIYSGHRDNYKILPRRSVLQLFRLDTFSSDQEAAHILNHMRTIVFIGHAGVLQKIQTDKNNTQLQKTMQEYLDTGSRSAFPCRVCHHVKLKKAAIRCALKTTLDYIYEGVRKPTDRIVEHKLDDYSSETRLPPISRSASNPSSKSAIGPVNINKYFSPSNAMNGFGQLTNLTDQVYVMHYSRNYYRLAQVTQFLRNDLNTSAELIVDMDREDLSQKAIRCIDWKEHSELGRDNLRDHVDFHYGHHRALKLGELSLIYKNLYAWVLMLIHNQNVAIIIEDDSELADEEVSMDKIVTIMKFLPKNFAMMHLGTCSYDKRGLLGQPRVLLATVDSRCTGAYAISKQGILLFFRNFPIRGAVDSMMIEETKWEKLKFLQHPDYRNYEINPAVIHPKDEMKEEAGTNIREF
ncbi:Glycine--tRNA ligase 1, mitochondrial [Blyttiomyces sp. JEL0837]|nr:Glycine--tRNA ligase 1, mitochondrial [Blyttiomyces sp. JEL0837]